ncbi:hypothetical protein ACB385_001171 [Staphylococcus pseudintermedius]|uniref:hypothetical protein n=1 Tax=Staphylococcus TaxID=1279 RepID=UPI000C1C6E79|nr:MULTISPECIES: hypothetical protein [Staphylococcus]EGQ1615971.1 hypothetical protein [Staphylococcus pseudintermedius]EGQ1646885.1 hypothetical protein [Staphylococcus pseudintermedius]EGQ1664760.1 hypothetical protein [Staphylococcus pseudintermedius]EGQ1685710.1 hypothetical protein [Staphylococcus pseudintermedius]EGQ1724435.1 hypothetical protein [Staphylococcus pseudintermedius]
MYTADDIKDMIFSYNWRKNRLIDEGYILDSNSIAQYGMESNMPKAQGDTSDKVLNVVTRNDTLYRVLYKHVEVIEFIDKYEHKIENDMNLNILYEFKKGKTQSEVRDIMMIGRTNLKSRLDSIVDVYLNEQNKQNKHNQHNQHNQQDKHNQHHKHNQH